MTILYQTELTRLDELSVRDSAAQVVVWRGREALKLNGLAVVPDLSLAQGSVQVQIGSEAAAYPGIVFLASDVLNYELAYAQPHTSGGWDALQYDPVFHGSNTWQLYHGAGFQQSAEIPMGDWFEFRIDFKDSWAVIRVGDQAPLTVNRLAHGHESGRVGIWTYLPAYFRDLRVLKDPSTIPAGLPEDRPPGPSSGEIAEWFLEGFGKVECEASGILNLNRYLPAAAGEARLTRWVEMLARETIEMGLGFSDELTLQLDDEVIYAGQNTYRNTPQWADRGYVAPNIQISHSATPGLHRLTATLKATEPFGWGMILALRGARYRLLPADLG